MIKCMTTEANMKPIVMIEETMTPEEAAAAEKRHEQFKRNSDWLEERAHEVYSKHRGKCICIAGQALFVADTATEAMAKAKTAHPGDQGWFTRYIPKEKVARIHKILDMSVLGRDILNLFAIIVDRAANVVAMIREAHSYTIRMQTIRPI